MLNEERDGIGSLVFSEEGFPGALGERTTAMGE